MYQSTLSVNNDCTLCEKLENQVIKCKACNHYCQIQPGKTGFCGVRLNIRDKLILTVHSHPCAVNMDPVEKKPMNHFYPGSQIFSIGTIGCNFKCEFCQNWEISQNKPKQDLEDYCNQQTLLTPAQVIELCKKKNCKLIAFTYNEPTIWFEYNLEICKLAKQNGMKTVYVSNGFMSAEAREILKDYISGTNIDLKAFSDQTYKKILGGSLQPVLDNIKYFYDNNVITEITTLVVPGMNDSEEELRKCAKFLASVGKDIPWHVSAFHPDYKMQDTKCTPAATLNRAFQIGKEEGLVNIYVGNVANDHESTYCPKCNSILVQRRGYSVNAQGIQNGVCAKCGNKPYGMFTW